MLAHICTRRYSRKPLRARRIDAQALVDDGLQIRQLLRCGGVYVGVRRKPISNLLRQSGVAARLFEQMERCGCEECRHRLPARNTINNIPERWDVFSRGMHVYILKEGGTFLGEGNKTLIKHKYLNVNLH